MILKSASIFFAAVVLMAIPQKSFGSLNESVDLSIQVTPDKAYIVPGSGKSCYDRLRTTTDNDPRSISENRVFFRNLRLQWRSQDDLTISLIRVRISGSQIMGGEFVAHLSELEIESLIGGAGGKIKGVDMPGAQKTIDSSDPDRGDFINVAACGLTVGGIEFRDSIPVSFSAPVTIEVFGTAENLNTGVQYPVHATTNATAEYY